MKEDIIDEETGKEIKVVGKGKEPKVVYLDTPISWGTEEIKKITLKPPKGKHIRKLPREPGMNDLLNLASKLSGVSGGVFDEMESSDVLKVVEAVGELL